MTVFRLVLVVSFLSGFSSFLHQAVWIRSLGYVLGNSAASGAVVIAAFTGGLGLGGLLLSPRVRIPRWGYGLLQVSVAAFGFALPWTSMEGPVWPGGGGDFAIGFLLVLVPAFLIGASFPLLFALLGTEVERSRAAAIYGVNAAGAVLGAAVGPYLGVAAFGLIGTGCLAAALNLGNALLVGLLGGATRIGGGLERSVSPAAPRRGLLLPSAVLFLAGFLGLGLEILVVRALVFYLKGYALVYAAVISVFLAGQSLGSFLMVRKPRKPADPRSGMGVALLFAAAGTMVPLALGGAVGSASWIWNAGDSFSYYLRIFGVAALFCLPATIPLGALVPLAYEALHGEASRRAGKVAFWNCLGSSAAPLAVGLFLIQAFSLSACFLLLAGAAALAGGILLWACGRKAWAPAAALPVLLLAQPDLLDPFLKKCWVFQGMPHLELLAYKDGRDFGVGVVEDGYLNERTLLTDSFRAAGTAEDYRYMQGLGHLPVLLHPAPRDVCVVCFGTGTTAGAVAFHEEVERISLVEIAPEVVEFAPYFYERNRDVYPAGRPDPRAVFALDDGRRYLRTTQDRFDIITLEPLLPVTPAAVHFYTLEFYRLAARRLKPEGVLCQWVPTHAVAPETYKVLLRTFFAAFPAGSLWILGDTTVLLGAAPGGRGVRSPEALRGDPDLPRVLARMGFGSLEELFASCLGRGAELLERLREAELLRDDRPFVEWFGFQSGLETKAKLVDNLRFLLELRDLPPLDFPPAPYRENKFRFVEARRQAASEDLLLHMGLAVPAGKAASLFEALEREAPTVEIRRWRALVAGREAFREGIRSLGEGEPGRARESFEKAARESPQTYRPWLGLAAARFAAGERGGGKEALARAFTLCPRLRETVDWAQFCRIAPSLSAEESFSRPEETGRRANAEAIRLRPDWTVLAERVRSEEPTAGLVLWWLLLRARPELERIAEERLARPVTVEEGRTLSALLEFLASPRLLSLAAFRWGSSPEKELREAAAVFFGDLSGKDGLRELVDLLEDPEASVQSAAIASLYRRTRESFGYDFHEPAEERRAAVGRWRKWLQGLR